MEIWINVAFKVVAIVAIIGYTLYMIYSKPNNGHKDADNGHKRRPKTKCVQCKWFENKLGDKIWCQKANFSHYNMKYCTKFEWWDEDEK